MDVESKNCLKNSVLMLFIKVKSSESFFFSSGKLFLDLGVGTCWERNLFVAKGTVHQMREFPVCDAMQVSVDKI